MSEFQGAVAAPQSVPRLRTRALLVLGFLAYVGVAALAWWAVLRLVPSTLSLELFDRTLQTDSVHEHINNAALIALLLPSALWIECAVVGWRASSARQLLADRTPSLKSDLACFLLGQAHVLDIVGRLMILGASIVSGAWVNAWLKANTGVALGPPDLPTPVLVVLFFFVYTFFDYWTHRLDHTPRFWPIHRYHHSARDFGVVTSVRHHPAVFTATFIINFPLAVMGAPPDVMLYVNVLVVGIGFIIHSKIDSNWGWVGDWLIQSPNHHRLHHKLDMSHPTGHFAICPLWDRLFGTWYGYADQTLPIGVDTPYRHGFNIAGDMLRDYAHFWMGWFGAKTDGPESDIVLRGKPKAATASTA